MANLESFFVKGSSANGITNDFLGFEWLDHYESVGKSTKSGHKNPRINLNGPIFHSGSRIPSLIWYKSYKCHFANFVQSALTADQNEKKIVHFLAYLLPCEMKDAFPPTFPTY